jgi:glycosyltransferase involved in cell wall biosynthesis
MNRIHLWTPELFAAAGGIQTFARAFHAALTCQLPAEAIRVQSKNDLPAAIQSNGSQSRTNAFGACAPPLRSVRFAADCWLRAYRERPRLVIATHVNFGPLAQTVRVSLNIPYVLLAYGIDVWQLRSPARQRALVNADLVLSISRYTRDYLIDKVGVEADRVQLLAPTFSPDRFTIKQKPSALLEKYHLRADTPVILTVCRLAADEKYKGYDRIIQALPKILRAVPGARYLLVGAGADQPRIEQLIRNLGLHDAVTPTGFVPDNELADYYNLCDVFAMPSKAEGFGIVYLEALACGKPVLAGNRDGSRDALADGELGILVDPDNLEEIAGEIIAVLRRQHPHPNIFRAEFLRRRVNELFGPDIFQKNLAQRLQPFLAKEILSLHQEEHFYVRHS